MKYEKLLFKNRLLGAVIMAMVLWFGTTAEAKIVANFSQCGYFFVNQPLEMAEGDSLKIYDPATGFDIPVESTNYNTGHWHLGLFNSEGFVVGWAMNLYKGNGEGRDSWLAGHYSGAVVYEGDEIV